MAQITMGGKPVKTIGEIPKPGDSLKDFKLVDTEMANKSLKDYAGKRLLMNIFPSVNTGVCSASVRAFNQKAAGLENTVVLNISRDLPFMQKNFCAAEGIENVEMLSDFRYNKFGHDYQNLLLEGGFEGLLSRCVIVADENHKVLYSEQVPEIGQEPDYDAAINALK